MLTSSAAPALLTSASFLTPRTSRSQVLGTSFCPFCEFFLFLSLKTPRVSKVPFITDGSLSVLPPLPLFQLHTNAEGFPTETSRPDLSTEVPIATGNPLLGASCNTPQTQPKTKLITSPFIPPRQTTVLHLLITVSGAETRKQSILSSDFSLPHLSPNQPINKIPFYSHFKEPFMSLDLPCH